MFNIIYLEVGHTSVEELLSGIYFFMDITFIEGSDRIVR